MRNRIYLSPPHMSGKELELVKDAFASNWIAPMGPHLNAFEKELTAYVGMDHCVALSSGTAAIHLALIMLGVERGDEVICSSFTFAGSCNPIVYQGATPVFIDAEKDTWNMDPDLLVEALKERTRKGRKPKAIILVHLYGMPAKLDAIRALAHRYEIPLIEDAAEALGSTYKKKMLGSFGDIGILSFNGNKIITTSGGGALLTNKMEWATKARFLSTQARDPEVHYEHSEIGYNYRLSNVCAAIGRGQLEVIDERVSRRREIFENYRTRLSSVPSISFPMEGPDCHSNRWLTTIVVDSARAGGRTREDVRIALERENIESRPLWKPMHMQPVFRDAPAYINGVSERLFANGMCLPSGSALTEAEQDLIVSIMTKALHAS